MFYIRLTFHRNRGKYSTGWEEGTAKVASWTFSDHYKRPHMWHRDDWADSQYEEEAVKVKDVIITLRQKTKINVRNIKGKICHNLPLLAAGLAGCLFNIILKLHILDSSLCFLVPSPVMQVREERKIASLKDEEDRGDEAESVLTKWYVFFFFGSEPHFKVMSTKNDLWHNCIINCFVPALFCAPAVRLCKFRATFN